MVHLNACPEQVVCTAAEQFALQLIRTWTTHKLLHEEYILRNGQSPAQQKRYRNDNEQ